MPRRGFPIIIGPKLHACGYLAPHKNTIGQSLLCTTVFLRTLLIFQRPIIWLEADRARSTRRQDGNSDEHVYFRKGLHKRRVLATIRIPALVALGTDFWLHCSLQLFVSSKVGCHVPRTIGGMKLVRGEVAELGRRRTPR